MAVETEEAKLLRLMIGYLHVLTMHSYALGTENKHLHTMSQHERKALENRMMVDVVACARDATPAVLEPIPPVKRVVH